MTIQEFARLVKTMRQKQAVYFRSRDTMALNEAIVAEKIVDAAVEEILSPQPNLFEQDIGGGD